MREDAPVAAEALAGAAQDASPTPPSPEDQLRADTYKVLGRLLAAPPDTALLEQFARVPVSEEEGLLAVAWQLLATCAERTTAEQAADEYQNLFIGIGRGELVPYASWYLTGFLMEQPLAKLRADMRRLGFERQEDVAEPEDHAGALCEIMALLAVEDDSDGLQTQAGFFQDHIAPWMARFFRDLQEARSARLYRAVGQLGEQFIETDQRYLELVKRPDGGAAEASRPVTS
ncbi:MAG: molecular chaperone TorD family protein [Gammaproteobacteria bacterium]|jgi:TorA maturation chaperone TorD